VDTLLAAKESSEQLNKIREKLKRKIGKKIIVAARDYVVASKNGADFIKIHGTLESVFENHFVLQRFFNGIPVKDSFQIVDIYDGNLTVT